MIEGKRENKLTRNIHRYIKRTMTINNLMMIMGCILLILYITIMIIIPKII